MLVECRWLQHLAGLPQVTEVPALEAPAQQLLEQLTTVFSVQDAQEVKDVSMSTCCASLWASGRLHGQGFCGAQVERVTNHDVKAVEYVLKQRFAADAQLAKAGAGSTMSACVSAASLGRSCSSH